MKIPVQNPKQNRPSIEEQLAVLQEKLERVTKEFGDFRIATEECLRLHREQIAIMQEKNANNIRNDFLLRKNAMNVFKK